MASPTGGDGLGRAAPHFMLPDADGQIYALDEIRGRNGTVILFLCNHCPYVKAIAPRLAAEADALRDLGVSVAAINANDAGAYPEDAFERMGPFARAHGWPFPYLHDASQRVARAFGAVCTPDVFGYDRGLRLRYRGRLDSAGMGKAEGARPELREAMAAIARGGEAPAAQVPSIGCSIKWRDPA